MKTIKIECPECKGTGLYKGMCERDACAVVCSKCNGTGCVDFSYNEYTGRKERDDVKRVFEKTCGYVYSDKNITGKNGKTYHFEYYGCTYEEWLNGARPTPMEELCCPYIYYNQGIGHEPLIDCDYKKRTYTGKISDCPKYEQKSLCWQKFNARVDINPYFDFDKERLNYAKH